jgi:uncharacterized protein YjbI with pentapeptide repeats
VRARARRRAARHDWLPSHAAYAKSTLNRLWAPRSRKVGTRYGAAWRRDRAPYAAEDFDIAYFSAAPADQQLPGFLRGDEDLVLQNLHPGKPVWSSKLPGVRARAFANDRAGAFREVPLVLDTLTIDVEAARLYLTWRGRTEVATDDLVDVTSVLLVSEKLDAERRPLDEYREALLAFEADPVGIGDALPPALLQAAAADAEGGDAVAAAREAARAPRDGSTDPVSALLAKELGGSAEGVAATKAMGALLGATAANEAVDLRATLEKAVTRAEAEPAEPPTPLIHKPGHKPDAGVRRTVIALERDLAPVEAALLAAAARGEIPPEARDKLAEIAKVREGLRAPALLELDPEALPRTPPSTDPIGPGACLVDRDLSDQDLSGADISGADLSHAILVRTNLRGANLRGARLHRAVLFQADLEGADLRLCDLTTCNAAYARASGADLSGATLSMGYFHRAKLRGAKLTGAVGEYAYLVEADLDDADLGEVRLEHVELSGARLERARLVGATIHSGRFNEVRAPRADFSRATLSYSSFDKAHLEGARFADARASSCLFSDAVLDDADLAYAWLLSCHFIGMSAERADFTAANLREARLERARLDHARFEKANLLRANLAKARVASARFAGANLDEAILLGAAGERADFTGANVKRAVFGGDR